MDRMSRLLTLLIGLLVMALATPAIAQTGVYVTTQDYVALRAGPAQRFDKLDVIPPTTTLEAIGRSADTHWIQVDYNGRRGWIAARFIVWSGDIVSIPVDGIDPQPFVRRAVVSVVTHHVTPYYRREVTPEDQIGTIPDGIELEATGRVGEGQQLWLQVRYQNALVWIGSWDVWLTGGDYSRLWDAGSLYPYGRLISQLRGDVRRGLTSLSAIQQIWAALASAQPVSCDSVPGYVVRLAVDNDVKVEPIFAPVAQALDDAVADINTSISTFADACSNGSSVTQADVRQALDGLATAQRNLTLAAALLNELRNRDPLLNGPDTE